MTATHKHDGGAQGERVLVTGASGYVGSRLIPRLLAAGYSVRAAMRSPAKAERFDWGENVETVRMDAGEPDEVRAALQGVNAAYYLLHSMDGSGFAQQDLELARSFGQAARAAGVQTLVYLGGLVPEDGKLSPHLASRLEVEQTLRDSGVPTVIALRAGILIGGGSTSFELIRRLVERLPLIPLPHFMEAQIQPVAITDALDALEAAVGSGGQTRSVDVAGPDILSYRELVRSYARAAGLKRRFLNVISVPYLLLSVPATWISGLPGPTVRALVPSLDEDLIARPGHTQRELLSGGLGPGLSVREAYEASLLPEDSCEQAISVSDPEWAGGDVVVVRRGRRGQRVQRVRVGRGWWSRLVGTHR